MEGGCKGSWHFLFKPDKSNGVEWFVDTDFAGDWSNGDADNAQNVISRTDYVIF